MKHFKLFLNKNKDFIIVFALFLFISIPYLIDICSGYLNYINLDVQEFLLWNYTAINHLIPYRDIFYPYGLLYYFKNYNVIFALLFYLISPTLFTILYFIFKKVFKEKFILYFSILIFCIFILFLIGFQTFSRYGLFVVLSLATAYIFYFKKEVSKRQLIFIGTILSLVFTFVNDQGSYLFLSFIFSFIITKFFYFNNIFLFRLKYLKENIKELGYIIVGILIGILPFLLFLIFNGSPTSYLHYFKDVKEIITVAKTPLFYFINSPANILTILIVYFAIFSNLVKIILLKKKFSLFTFFQITLIYDILILEQKSMVRSIDTQITFVSLVLLMFIIYELVHVLKNYKINYKLVYIFAISIIVVLYSLTVSKKTINLPSITKKLNLLVFNKCFNYNLKYFLSNNPSYGRIINLLIAQQGFNSKIYSFPGGDSALYVLLNQKPPYYNAIFEGSSYINQISETKYIQSNKVEFINLNINKSAIQDGVPDFIRQSYLSKYILNNYHPFALISDHLILKKDMDKDFFGSTVLNKASDYKNSLLNVYLYKIPFSEGYHKYKNLLINSKLLITSNNIKNINLYFKNNKTYSDNKIIVLIPKITLEPTYLNTLDLVTATGLKTSIFYNSCPISKPCIINLARIPLFYRNRVIKNIELDKDFVGTIKIFYLIRQGGLW